MAQYKVPAVISKWSAEGSGYVGLSVLDDNSDPRYGWMEMSVPTTTAAGQKITLIQWGGESVANTPITIPAAAVPEIDPANFRSALALVLGSLGMIERRRQKAIA